MASIFTVAGALRVWLCAFVAAGLALASIAATATDMRVQVIDHDGRPLQNTAILASWPGAPASSGANQTAEVSQRHIAFHPHVLIVPVGTSVVFPNFDRTRHHVYSFSEAKTFNIKLYVGRPQRPEVFDKTGVITLGCNIHDQMQAFVVVTDKPRWARTDANGYATLHDLPSTDVDLSLWHPWMTGDDTRVSRQFATTPANARIQLNVSAPPPPPNTGGSSLQDQFDRISG